MKRTYYKVIPQDKEDECVRALKKLKIVYTILPISEPGCSTLMFACTAIQKIRLASLFRNI